MHRIICPKLLSAIYRNDSDTLFRRICLASIVLNIIVFASLYSTWYKEIEQKLSQAIKEVDPDYYNIIKSDEKLADMRRAFTKNGDKVPTYIYNDEISQKLRAFADKFSIKFREHIKNKELEKLNSLDILFGDALSSPSRYQLQYLVTFMSFVMATVASCWIDFVGALCILRFYRDKDVASLLGAGHEINVGWRVLESKTKIPSLDL